jgi:RepB DNA-primase from phage plasmid
VSDINAAFRMLDTFTSVGADSFVVTKTDVRQELKWGKTYSPSELREKLPSMVRTAAIRRPSKISDTETILAGENLIFRPIGKNVAFVQLDDLSAEQLERVRPAVFLIHATSPGSHQAWIAVTGLPEGKGEFKQFMRRVRKAVGGNDKSASHATRVAGTENFKEKYNPNFPTVTILETHPGRIMTAAQLEEIGLVAAPEPEISAPAFAARASYGKTGSSHFRREKVWPDYARSLAGAPPRLQGSGPDRSMADFAWCMTAIDWGWSIEDTAAKLPEVSEKARERVRLGDDGYPLITSQNAAAAVERNDRKRGRG